MPRSTLSICLLAGAAVLRVFAGAAFAGAVLAQAAIAEPELHASARPMHGVIVRESKTPFALGAGQSQFNLGTSREQSRARSDVGIKIDKQNPAIMTIVGGSEADIQKLLAKRYHRVVVPVVPYSAPSGPMQQTVSQQQINIQTLSQQTMAQQVVVQQPTNKTQIQPLGIGAMPMETVNRFINIFHPQTNNTPALTAEAKPLKPFGTPTYVRWDPWYARIKGVSTSRWAEYNNQLNTEATAHVIVYNDKSLAVTGVDINLFKSEKPFDANFNNATKMAVLQILNGMKGSPTLQFPTNTRRSEVSFDLVFATGGSGAGRRAGVNMNSPINDVETIYGL